jgi:hypothetical protein
MHLKLFAVDMRKSQHFRDFLAETLTGNQSHA